MNPLRLWLALGSAVCLALATQAAPVPERAPESEGPVTDGLRLRSLVPATEAPSAMKVAVKGDKIEVARRSNKYVTEVRQRIVPVTEYVARQVTKPDGQVVVEQVPVTKNVVQQYTVVVPVAIYQQEQVALKACSFFEVSRQGKLEAVPLDRATTLLKERSVVLTGESATLDPRQLDLIKPGTLYVVLPPAGPPGPGPEIKPPERR
jgi:hypothetical protein